MAYEGTDEEGNVFRGGDPSPEEEQHGEMVVRNQEGEAAEWNPDGVKSVHDL